MKKHLLLLVSGLFYTNFVFAWDPFNPVNWSWQSGIINNLDVPLRYEFHQKNKGHATAIDGTQDVGVIPPNSSQIFKMTVGGNLNLTTDGVLNLSNEKGLHCSIRYYQEAKYSAHNLGQWNLDGKDNSPECSELFISSTEASDDDWKNFIANFIKFPRLTKGQIQCAGIDNCVVINPPQYNTQWAVQNINRQTHLSDYEFLNIGQTIGTHNSVISRSYTTKPKPPLEISLNMSYVDPNQYINIIDQLNLGVRQIELDFYDTKSYFKICHFHIENDIAKDFLNPTMCANNFDLKIPLQDVNNWLASHPNELLYVYLDNTDPWSADRVNAFDDFLTSTFNGKVLTKTDLSTDVLPVKDLTKFDIINKFKKNIIVYTHNTNPNWVLSKSVFTHVAGNPKIELHNDVNISDFMDAKTKCRDDKKCLVNEIFAADPEHTSIRVVREDRTHLTQEKGPYQDFSVYLTNSKLKTATAYPVNVFDFDKLALDDARLIQAVWSFKYPYPLSVQAGGVDYAFIDPATGKFSNQKLAQTNFNILCFNKDTQTWFIANNDLTDKTAKTFSSFTQKASDTCAQQGNAVFAAPVSGYQLDEIIRSGIIQLPTVINYSVDAQGAWHVNSDKSVGFVTKE